MAFIMEDIIERIAISDKRYYENKIIFIIGWTVV